MGDRSNGIINLEGIFFFKLIGMEPEKRIVEIGERKKREREEGYGEGEGGKKRRKGSQQVVGKKEGGRDEKGKINRKGK